MLQLRIQHSSSGHFSAFSLFQSSCNSAPPPAISLPPGPLEAFLFKKWCLNIVIAISYYRSLFDTTSYFSYAAHFAAAASVFSIAPALLSYPWLG